MSYKKVEIFGEIISFNDLYDFYVFKEHYENNLKETKYFLEMIKGDYDDFKKEKIPRSLKKEYEFEKNHHEERIEQMTYKIKELEYIIAMFFFDGAEKFYL